MRIYILHSDLSVCIVRWGNRFFFRNYERTVIKINGCWTSSLFDYCHYKRSNGIDLLRTQRITRKKQFNGFFSRRVNSTISIPLAASV